MDIDLFYRLRDGPKMRLTELIQRQDCWNDQVVGLEALAYCGWLCVLREEVVVHEAQPLSMIGFVRVLVNCCESLLAGQGFWVQGLEESFVLLAVPPVIEISFFQAVELSKLQSVIQSESNAGGIVYPLLDNIRTSDAIMLQQDARRFVAHIPIRSWLEKVLLWGRSYTRVYSHIGRALDDCTCVVPDDAEESKQELKLLADDLGHREASLVALVTRYGSV